MKLVGKLIAVACIFIAIYDFDVNSFKQWIVSILLLLTATITLSPNNKINKNLALISVPLGLIYFTKLLIFG